jgi:hypothetical protein
LRFAFYGRTSTVDFRIGVVAVVAVRVGPDLVVVMG